MRIAEMDSLIRSALPDGAERRNLLTALHDMSEGMNHMLGFLLAVQGYTYNAESDAWTQDSRPKRQVNPPLRS